MPRHEEKHPAPRPPEEKRFKRSKRGKWVRVLLLNRSWSVENKKDEAAWFLTSKIFLNRIEVRSGTYILKWARTVPVKDSNIFVVPDKKEVAC